MTLRTQIDEDIKAAMKAKDKVRLVAVRSIKKALLEKEVELRVQGRESLSTEEELALLAQQAKQRRESIEQYQQAGRPELVDQETQELAVIEGYLPAQLTEAEVLAIITEVIQAVGATSPKEMGKVMGPVMQRVKGQTDGKTVQRLVQAQLGQR